MSCSPHDSLAWIVLFALALQAGRLDAEAFGLLEASYETSPNEAWIGIRRVGVAAPVSLLAPTDTRQKLLAEFSALIEHGFVELPAQAYVRSHQAVRELLDTAISPLDPLRQRRFREAVQKLRPAQLVDTGDAGPIR